MGTRLVRAVDKAHMKEISATGTRPWTYWTSLREMAAYYEECLDDEDKEAVVLVVDMDDLDTQGAGA